MVGTNIVSMNKQEIKDLINSIETRISNRCHENGNEEIQVILYEMRNGKFFPNESIEMVFTSILFALMVLIFLVQIKEPFEFILLIII
jgi:hypothetical protein